MNKVAFEGTRLLVVSRDSAILGPLWSMGESNGWHLETVPDPWDAIERTQSDEPLSALVLDLPRGGSECLLSLGRLRRMRPELPIILIGYEGDNGRQQEGLRMGARDYLLRPFADSQLQSAIQRSLGAPGELAGLDIVSDDVEPVSDSRFFIGVSPVMRRLRAQAALLAEANVPILILGEPGSGKETLARLIHQLSVRSGFAFARVNCAALPEDLLQQELFGTSIENANTAARAKPGKLELCANGTLFLDDIAELPATLHANLIHVLESRRFTRPGTTDTIAADVRIVAAASQNTERSIAAAASSEQFDSLLSAYTIHIPPLRDRKDELPLLARHFMHRIAKQYGMAPRAFTPAIIEAWQAWSWPGNLRELESRVKRFLLVGDDELAMEMPLASERLPHPLAWAAARSAEQPMPPSIQLAEHAVVSGSLRSVIKSVRAEAERNAIAVALQKTGWNRKAAARLLNVSYRSILYKIEQYSLSSSSS